MRTLFNPFKALGNIFSPSKPKIPQVSSAAEDARLAAKAREEAARKARSDAAKRAGSRSTFLTPPRLGETFGTDATTTRKRLTGAN